jgi:hypothetical protein
MRADVCLRIRARGVVRRDEFGIGALTVSITFSD